MITRLLNKQEDAEGIPFDSIGMLSIIFPDTGNKTNTYNFKPFYKQQAQEGENEYPRTLQIAFTDLYEMGDFVAELQKAINFAFARATQLALNPDPT